MPVLNVTYEHACQYCWKSMPVFHDYVHVCQYAITCYASMIIMVHASIQYLVCQRWMCHAVECQYTMTWYASISLILACNFTLTMYASTCKIDMPVCYEYSHLVCQYNLQYCAGTFPANFTFRGHASIWSFFQWVPVWDYIVCQYNIRTGMPAGFFMMTLGCDERELCVRVCTPRMI